MSEHEEVHSDGSYVTPVPELDDHRNQAVATQRQDRPRRGTFDSLYGARLIIDFAHPQESTRSVTPDRADDRNDRGAPNARDSEEAVDDAEAGPTSASAPPQFRRPTFESAVGEPRGVSPPNSVKAFAEARRRERGFSFSADRKPDARSEVRSDTRSEARPDEDGLTRTVSVASRRSRRSKPITAAEPDAASLSSNRTAEEDVCFPMLTDHRRDQLYIDFDFLEHFITTEAASRTVSKCDSSEPPEAFEDLRPQQSAGPNQVSTIDGDIIDLPTASSEKGIEPKKPEQPAPPQPQHDPNRVSFFSSAWESTIHAAELGDLVLPGESIRDLFSLPKDEADGVWWLNMNNPTRDEIQGICKAFRVHPLTVEDIGTQEAREKIELFPSYYFASFRSFNTVPEDDGVEYEPFNIYVVVFREGTLSFSFAPNSHATQVRKRIAVLQDFVALSSDWICYALIDDIVDSFAPVIQQIETEADSIEDQVFIAREDSTNKFLRSIGRVRKNVMALMRLLGGKADVLRGFTKRCNENYTVTPRMDIGLYLGDIQDHVVTMVTNLGHFEKILSRAHSNYLAQLSINNISQSNDTNKVLSKITLLASILVPLNLICGLFGMNVMVPFREMQSTVPFFTIVGLLFAVSILILGLARKFKYI